MGISRMHALVEPSQDIPDGVVLTTKHPGDVLFVEHNLLHRIRRSVEPGCVQFRLQFDGQNRASTDVGTTPALAGTGFKLGSDSEIRVLHGESQPPSVSPMAVHRTAQHPVVSDTPDALSPDQTS